MRPKPDKQGILLFYLLKKLNKCHRAHQLLQDGDRIALALSGGKDSCTLLHALVQRRGVERYTLIPIHVLAASDMECGARADVPALTAWLDQLGVEYHLATAEEVQGEPHRPQQSPCFYCAWRTRKALFDKAQELGCNKLALAHNADDVAQTTLLNLFFQGKVTTMFPRVTLFGGNLTLIRPLAYVPEKDIEEYAAEADLPAPPPPCPAGRESKRHLMRQILAMVEQSNPNVRIQLWRAIERCQPSLGLAVEQAPPETASRGPYREEMEQPQIDLWAAGADDP
jgi:tRNA 2-thiocytidine biosynthesis protein TtcA